MTFPVGALRRRIRVETPSDVADGAGGFTRTWTKLMDVFGAIDARRRRESVDDGRQVGVVTHRITVRQQDALSGTVRFVADGVTYHVLAAEDADPQRRFLHFWCEEEQA